MRTPLLPLASIIALTTVLSACGQKGPLYLPQDPAAPTTSSATGAHSHDQRTSEREDETKDPSQRHAEQPSKQHTEAEAVTK